MSCSICNSDSREIARTRNGFKILRCTGCDLVFSSPIPSPEELKIFYQGFAYSRPDESDLKRQIEFTEAGTKSIVHEVNRLTKRTITNVLDFGGGLGFFANALSQHYQNVTLFDLDAESRTFARKRFGDHLQIVDETEEALSSQYDLILVNQVIEHVPDPISFLASFLPALLPGGILIVTTPNNLSNDALVRPDIFLHYIRRLALPKMKAAKLLLTDSWLCCDPPRHLYSFNGVNLTDAGRRAGFRPVESRTAAFDRDPYGQPKYNYRGFQSARQSAQSLLFLFSKISTLLGRAIDRSGRHGTTLISYFTV